MEGLSFDNIWGEQEIDNLFQEPGEEPSGETGGTVAEEPAPVKEGNDDTTTTEVVNPEELFKEDTGEETQPESVGSGKKAEEKRVDASPDNGGGTSPQNFYSSIAIALAVDGIFPNSDEEAVGMVDSAESFSDLIDAEINARLDEKQLRISKALENGVEPSDIRMYETTLNNISRITDVQLSEESERGEKLRRDLIYQDYINRGFSPERAQKKTEQSFDAGNDIEDAKDALQSNKDFFQNKYNDLLEEAQKDADRQKADRQKQEAKLKDSILKDKQLMGDMEISQDVRKKVYDNISRPVYKDPETGQYLTAIQKYESENHADFMKYVSLFYTLTDGFKDFKSFAKAEVKKEMRKGLRELEQTLSNTRRTPDGRLDLSGSRRNDPESFLGGGFKLAL